MNNPFHHAPDWPLPHTAAGLIEVKDKKNRWRRIYFAAGSKVNNGFTVPLGAQ
jgi:hypothetical protein